MKLTQEEFLERVNAVAQNNLYVRALLRLYDGYDNVPESQKQEIHEAVGVKVKIVREYFTVEGGE